MKNKILRSQSGITLTEVLLGIVIIAIIAAGSITAVNVLFASGQMSRERSVAVNLLQKSQEEVRRLAQTSFDSLNNCAFPPDEGDTCGLAIIEEDFPNHTRTLNVVNQGSAELKQIEITVSWNELGVNRQLNSVLLMARPPDALPGNIVGVVTECSGGDIIGGAVISAVLDGGTETHSVSSAASFDADGYNYDFSSGNTFAMSAGLWELTATHVNYVTTDPVTVTIESNEEEEVNICMEANPDDGQINWRVVDQTNGNATVSHFDGGADVRLFQNGSQVDSKTNQRTGTFTIAFDDPDEVKTYTLNSTDAFKAGLAGFPSCSFVYDKEGWSSAETQADGTLVCNGRNGSAATDRIEVRAGETTEVDIEVQDVPRATVTGRVIDSDGAPIVGATVYARWPRSDQADWRSNGSRQTATTGTDGRFTFIVPAVQEMFANSNPSQNYLQVWASARVSFIGCCNTPSTQNRNSSTKTIGPLFLNNVVDGGDFTIGDVSDHSCGDVEGVVFDAQSGGTLSGAAVRIRSTNASTNGAGFYEYVCPDEGFRLRVSAATTAQISLNGYYNLISTGNNWYSALGVPEAVIIKDTLQQYDARLWPEGFGQVRVRVFDEDTGLTIPDIRVTLRLYTGFASNQITEGSGEVTFDSVLETWPPPLLPQTDPYFNHGVLRHTVSVEDTNDVYIPVSVTTEALNAGETITVNINMQRQSGGM